MYKNGAFCTGSITLGRNGLYVGILAGQGVFSGCLAGVVTLVFWPFRCLVVVVFLELCVLNSVPAGWGVKS